MPERVWTFISFCVYFATYFSPTTYNLLVRSLIWTS
nr:MAG TPA: hypothetical protein [Caudoviricetes sp.]